jgi:16S rRNA (cytidine1402-2'-O)-methyltransferase
VVLIDRGAEAQTDEAGLQEMLREALGRLRVKDAAAEVAMKTGVSKRIVYQLAIKLSEE